MAQEVKELLLELGEDATAEDARGALTRAYSAASEHHQQEFAKGVSLAVDQGSGIAKFIPRFNKDGDLENTEFTDALFPDSAYVWRKVVGYAANRDQQVQAWIWGMAVWAGVNVTQRQTTHNIGQPATRSQKARGKRPEAQEEEGTDPMDVVQPRYVVPAGPGRTDDECIVCLAPRLQIDQLSVTLACHKDHKFHLQCLLGWVRTIGDSQATCPMCKEPLLITAWSILESTAVLLNLPNKAVSVSHEGVALQGVAAKARILQDQWAGLQQYLFDNEIRFLRLTQGEVPRSFVVAGATEAFDGVANPQAPDTTLHVFVGDLNQPVASLYFSPRQDSTQASLLTQKEFKDALEQKPSDPKEMWRQLMVQEAMGGGVAEALTPETANLATLGELAEAVGGVKRAVQLLERAFNKFHFDSQAVATITEKLFLLTEAGPIGDNILRPTTTQQFQALASVTKHEELSLRIMLDPLPRGTDETIEIIIKLLMVRYARGFQAAPAEHALAILRGPRRAREYLVKRFPVYFMRNSVWSEYLSSPTSYKLRLYFQLQETLEPSGIRGPLQAYSVVGLANTTTWLNGDDPDDPPTVELFLKILLNDSLDYSQKSTANFWINEHVNTVLGLRLLGEVMANLTDVAKDLMKDPQSKPEMLYWLVRFATFTLESTNAQDQQTKRAAEQSMTEFLRTALLEDDWYTELPPEHARQIKRAFARFTFTEGFSGHPNTYVAMTKLVTNLLGGHAHDATVYGAYFLSYLYSPGGSAGRRIGEAGDPDRLLVDLPRHRTRAVSQEYAVLLEALEHEAPEVVAFFDFVTIEGYAVPFVWLKRMDGTMLYIGEKKRVMIEDIDTFFIKYPRVEGTHAVKATSPRRGLHVDILADLATGPKPLFFILTPAERGPVGGGEGSST